MPAVPRTWQALLKEASPLSLGVDWAQNDCVPALLLPVRTEQLLATVLHDIRWHHYNVGTQEDPAAQRMCGAGEVLVLIQTGDLPADWHCG